MPILMRKQDPGIFSTKTDSTGGHIGGQGHWGLCGPTCPLQVSSISSPSTSSPSTLPPSPSTSTPRTCTSSDGTSGVCVSPALCIGADLANLRGQECLLLSGRKGAFSAQRLFVTTIPIVFSAKGLCCGTSLAGGSVLPSAAVSPVPDSTLPAITIKEVEQLLREVILIVALTNIITTMMYLKVPGTSIRSAAAKGGSTAGDSPSSPSWR